MCQVERLTCNASHVIIVYVERGRWGDNKTSSAVTITVSPLLGSKDIADVARQLERGIAKDNRAAQMAIQQALADAIDPQYATDIFRRHIFVLCLAAALGKYRPAEEWMAEVHAALQAASAGGDQPTAYEAALVTAFVSSFCANEQIEEQLVPYDLLAHYSAGNIPPMFHEICREMEAPSFPPYKASRWLAATHPMFARLFLQAAFPDLSFSRESVSDLGLDALKKLVSQVSSIVQMRSMHPAYVPLLMKRLFVTRCGHDDFSRLVLCSLPNIPSLLLSKPSGATGANQTCTCLTSLLRMLSAFRPIIPAHLASDVFGHVAIVLARAHRQMAYVNRKDYHHRFYHIAMTLQQADLAVKFLASTDNLVVAMQLKAAMLINAALFGPVDVRFSRAVEAEKLLSSLFESATDNRRPEIVTLALKLPQPDATWHQRARDYPTNGSNWQTLTEPFVWWKSISTLRESFICD
eukprot:m.251180 g.251180  ORF g.251180 m.251180 type:complete len:466 (+) comp17101_c0_seq1:2383-3780(+)